MGKSILWYQPQDPREDDVVFLNGTRLTEVAAIQDNFHIIAHLTDVKINKRSPWCGMADGYFFVKGVLDAKDNHGRTMVFLYATDRPDPQDACREELRAAGLKMSADTAKCLKRRKNRLLNKFLTKFWSFAIFGLIAIIALILLFS